MREKDISKGVLVGSQSQYKKGDFSLEKKSFRDKYFTFFYNAPIALWIEDFSEVKKFADKISKENNTDIKSFIKDNPEIIPKLASLVTIREVNKRALKLYRAKNQEELLISLPKIFTKKSREGFTKLVVDILIGAKETKLETVNKRLDGEEFDIQIKFEVVEGYEDSLENVIVTTEDISKRIRNRKKLAESEKRYRDLFEKSIDSVLILKDGLFVDCNESTLKIFGFENKESVLKVHPSNLSPGKQSDGVCSFIRAEEMINKAIANGSNRFRWYHQKKNGKIFPSEVTLTKIDDCDGNIKIHAVVKDISEKVKKETLEDVLYNISKAALTISSFKEFSFFIKQELHKIIDTSNFYIALYNEDTKMCNTPFYADDREEEVSEFYAENTLTGYVIKTKKPLLVNKESHSNLIKKGEVEIVGVESKVWVGVPLKINEKVLGVIAVQSYVNENEYNEKDVNLLEFVADQISTTIQRKKAYNELKIALTKAQESDRLKSAFLANMSHEIRTPMNGIIGFSELFLQPNLTGNQRNKYANIVIDSSKQLLSIVNDILDISKIEAGAVKLNEESVNINKLLGRLLNFYQPIASENNLELSCVKGLENYKSVIEIDKVKLNQVLTNLLSNAFKFTDKGKVEFGYEYIENYLKFYVKDTGVGIDPKIKDKIFDRFIQANVDLDKTVKGTGLGLAISKKFVELFGGEIWITSDNKGTTIYFTIPYKKPEISISSVITDSNQLNESGNTEIVVLVVEDEEYNRMYINELFLNSNYLILEAKNGAEAIEMVQKNDEIDLVLMDIKMPVMNGNEAMRQIKNTHPKLPIIALSAYAMESDKMNAINDGFSAYVTKPIDKKILFNVVNKFTSKKHKV